MSTGPTQPVLRTPAGHQAPRLGGVIGQGGEGVVYENLDEPGWVVKVFTRGGHPLAARNQLDNLARARAIRPDNVVDARPLLHPANPRGQNWVVEEEVTRSSTPEDANELAQLWQDFQNLSDFSVI
jgi:hypothetical protein